MTASSAVLKFVGRPTPINPAAPTAPLAAGRPPVPIDWIDLAGYKAISTSPVLAREFARFANATGRTAPRQPGGQASPAVNVSASDALTYAKWLSANLRLPTIEELQQLAWEDQNNPLINAFPGAGTPEGLGEWVSDPAEDGLYHIVQRSWLLHSESTLCQGALRDTGHSFITFRLVRDTH